MKNFIYLILSIAVLSACQEDKKETLEDVLASENVQKLTEKRNELNKEIDQSKEDLGRVNAVLAKLQGESEYPLVTTFKVIEGEFKHHIELQGDVRTKQNVIIFPEYSGLLSHVYVKEGDRVKKDQLLAKIDDGGLNQQLAQMEIQFELAKTTFERQARLWEQKIGSEMQYLQAKASFESQERAIKQLQDQLEKTHIRAPFNGVIDEVITEQGQVVYPGQNQLMRIVNLSNMYVKSEVPERYISKVKKGSLASLYFESLGTTLSSKVRQVGSYINPGNRTFSVEIPIENYNSEIKPNLIARVELLDYYNEHALLIPNNIIREDAEGNTFVYVVEQNKAKNVASIRKAEIKVGYVNQEFAEVLSGLSNEDIIVDEGAHNMRDGLTVKVLN